MKQKKNILIAIVSLLILAGALVFFTKGSDSSVGKLVPGSGRQEPKDMLRPTEPLTIWKTKYADPCNLLPQAEVEKLYPSNALPEPAFVREIYFDESQPTPRSAQSEYKLTCELLSQGATTEKKLSISLALPLDEVDAQRQLRFDTPDQKDIATDLDVLTKRLGSSISPETKKFIDAQRASVDKAVSYVTNPKGQIPTGLIFPEYIENSSLGGELGFITTTQYGLVTLRGTFASEGRAIADVQPKELDALLVAMSKSIDYIQKTTKSSEPVQSPVLPAFDVAKTPYGSNILDPCYVFDAKTFAISGLAQNSSIERETFASNFDFKRQQPTNTVTPSNSCTRSYNARNTPDSYALTPQEQIYGAGGYLDLGLTVRYAMNAEQVETYMKSYATASKITYNGGSAYRTGNTLVFNKGNYVLLLRGLAHYEPTKKGINAPGNKDIQLPDSTLQALANAIVNRIE